MAQIQGIIFKDIFVAHKEDFIRYFMQYYEQNSTAIQTAIKELDKALPLEGGLGNKEIANKFFVAWENFEKVVLGNVGDLQLMVGYRDPSSSTKGDIHLSQVIPQKSATIGAVIDAGSGAVRDAMRWVQQQESARKAETSLREHLNGFLQTLYKHHLQREDIRYLINVEPSPIPDKWWSAKRADGSAIRLSEELTGRNWQDIFYENYYSGQGLGQAYDAYMNHVANHHRAFYDYLATSGLNSSSVNIPILNTSVYEEEGGISGNFPYLLNESLNTTGWYTGGDIVIVDPETMSVVYNIQLKTTRDTHEAVHQTGSQKGEKYIAFPAKFNVAIGKIRLLIRGGHDSFAKKTHIGLLMMDSARAMAEELYEVFLTSISNSNEFDQGLNATYEEIIKPIRERTEKAIQIKLNL